MHKDEPSLLDHLTEVRKRVSPQDGGISAVIFCGRVILEANMSEALFTHRKIVEDEVNTEGCNITGILIGQGNAIIHFLEGPYVSVLNILRSLSEHSHFDVNAPIQAGKIMYNIEDRPLRSFPEWYSCVVQERKSQIEDVTPDNCIDLAHELAMGLFDVGKTLQNVTGEVEINKYANRLPGKALVLSFSNATEFFSITEFVEMYADSYHVELESERTWPVESLVRY